MCIFCTSLYVPFSFFFWPLCCSSSIYGFWLPLWYLPTLLCPFDHYVVCPSLIYGFWLPLWYLPTLLCPFGHYVVLLRYTILITSLVSSNSSLSFWPLCCLSFFDLWILITWYLQTFLVTYITYLKIDNNTHNCMFIFLRLNIYSQTCPCGHLY